MSVPAENRWRVALGSFEDFSICDTNIAIESKNQIFSCIEMDLHDANGECRMHESLCRCMNSNAVPSRSENAPMKSD
jgi:hypothetical protein